MPTDLLDRLRAADIAPTEADPPPFDETFARMQALRSGHGGHVGPTHRTRTVRRAIPAGVLATGLLAATFVVVIGSSDDTALPRLGVLQAAADTAENDPGAGRFSGYVEVQQITMGSAPGTPAVSFENRKVVQRVSATEFDGSLESTGPAPAEAVPPVPQRAGTPAPDDGGARITTRRTSDRLTIRRTWRRRYGTIFTGAIPTGRQPAAVPTNPDEARRAIASWAAGDAPTGGDTEQASHLRDAYGDRDGTQLALGYASDVLTAPGVAPQVRAAVYDALADVTGIAVEAHDVDPAGRPAASLTSHAVHGTSRSRFQLFIDPDTARVLGTRNRYEATPSPGRGRATDEPPTGTGGDSSVFRYTD